MSSVSSVVHATEIKGLTGQVTDVSSSIGGGNMSLTLHAGGAELLSGQVDGVVVLLGVTLLPLLVV